MLITRIELENIKSYRRMVIDFRRGTTAISGSNGVGKTTVVEAIGYALFGYLPYSQDQFVREGEKHGKVVVHLIGSDERPYTVERRCGSGARWLLFDEEANLRLEQRADVLDRLHDLFGIDRERPLDSLFRDALGVPQGTFTAIFLEPASKRKQTFDALLQIEDYKTAADKLLDTQKYYKEQMLEQKTRIDHLCFVTSELEQWREKLKEDRLLDEQQKAHNLAQSQQLKQYEEREVVLSEQWAYLTNLKQRFDSSQVKHENASNLLREREQQLQTARNAHQSVVENQQSYEVYLQAQEILTRLRRDDQQRNALLQQRAEQKNALAKIEARVNNWQERLAEVATARQKVVELAPLVDQQIELEKKRDEAIQQVERYKAIVNDGKRLNSQLAKCVQDQEKCQRKIAEIEPLKPVADLLQERNEALVQLRIQEQKRSSMQLQLQEKRNLLREKQQQHDQDAEKLRKAERNVEAIEEHRQEAEEMPGLQEQYEQLSTQLHRLEGNIEGYVKSRAQSAGGQCPLLKETCLNIKQRGIVSLESYFDGLLSTEHVEVERLRQQQTTISERMGQIKKYADALNKIGQYIERRDTLAEQLQRHAIDITRLEGDVTNLTQDLEALKQVEQRMSEAEAAYNESKSADAKVRDLSGLYKQGQQLQEQAQQLETDLQERRQQAAQFKGSEMLLAQMEVELATLNDPRSQSKTQQSIIGKEAYYQQQLQAEQQQQEEILRKIQTLDEQILVYASLDENIARQDAVIKQCENSHRIYLQNEQEAQRLPEREEAYRQQLTTTEQAEQQLRVVEQAYHEAKAAFNEEELKKVRGIIIDLRKELAALAQTMLHNQENINELEAKIAEAEKHLIELEAAKHAHQELEELHAMIEQFRKLIKEAAPHVLKAMLADISAESNRIFGEIMGDRSAYLSWRNDYEIVLRRQGVDRSFAQLSGGEQMSAALAVRLALLKKLSTLNIAIFDEPTQNMDELRRMNLADQIRRVRGFDQLIVISHDDTFEQGLDSLVRLNKVNGETRLVADEEDSVPQIDMQLMAVGRV
ncbi:MAG TPA: SMC family ATPase [Ktedonobacteraceae bacterium]|nr:SMC family ATPase [Ktedonobacteraceae bacterium]